MTTFLQAMKIVIKKEMNKFYDMKTREEKMCGFRSNKELVWALLILSALLVIVILASI